MIELKQARELLKAAVATQGDDFVYNPGGAQFCTYSPNLDIPRLDDPRRKTGCLIGVVLDLAGFMAHRDMIGNLSVVRNAHPNMMTFEAFKYLNIAQSHQDVGSTWGNAYRSAEEYLVNMGISE